MQTYIVFAIKINETAIDLDKTKVFVDSDKAFAYLKSLKDELKQANLQHLYVIDYITKSIKQ